MSAGAEPLDGIRRPEVGAKATPVTYAPGWWPGGGGKKVVQEEMDIWGGPWKPLKLE